MKPLLGMEFTQKRRSILVGVSGLLLGSLNACSLSSPLRLSGHPWPGYEPLFFAETQKQLPPSVSLQHLPTLKESIDALRDGRVDGAMLTLDEAMALQTKGLDLRVVLIMDVSKGADALLARKDIQTLTQLRGKRIALEASTLGELMLSLVLDRAGLKRAEVRPQFVDYEKHESAYLGGQVDAVITYEPVASRLAGLGAHKLVSTRDLPESIFDVLAVRADSVGQHADALEQTIRGHFWALEQLRRNPWDTAYRMVPHAGVSAEELMESFRGLELPDLVANRRYLSRDNADLTQIVAKLSAIMMASGVIKRPANAAALFTDAFLPRGRD